MEVNFIAYTILCVVVGVLIGTSATLAYVIRTTLSTTKKKAEADEALAEILDEMFKPENVKKKTKNEVTLEDKDGNKVVGRKVKKSVLKDDEVDK